MKAATPEKRAALKCDLQPIEAQNSADEDGKFGIGFKATFDRGASPTKRKVTCRVSKTFSDESESVVADTRQPELF